VSLAVIGTWPIPPHLSARIVANFAARVDVGGGPDVCWLWLGARLSSGYGQVPCGSRNNSARAHRIALEIKLGRPILPGHQANHTCDNPPCCNPLHLYEGTPRQNTADMMARGRARIPVLRGAANAATRPGFRAGERNGRHRLSDSSVRAIRERVANGERPVDLALEYGVSDTAISYAALGRTWSHVP